ncbi:unnamed protein product [Adineta steineri]|uniref:Disease resistance R13L4/SHOC-2-like LRR domain-containing protein n=1 Tax=Adineta steineri TaxID=433720 RepID=A0A815INU0_9BILA|nr:unnamed protein product [Adineta steineri]
MRFSTLMLMVISLLSFYETASVNFYQQQKGTQDAFQSALLFNCSKFQINDDIFESFPFKVELNPIMEHSKITFGLLDVNGNLYYLNIFNEIYFPLSGFCFKHLKELYVRKTNFQNVNNTIPAEIQYLAPTLLNLSIYDTIITHWPYEMSKLRKLETIQFSNTSLKILPDFIGNFLSLKFLSLPNNMLTLLSTTIVNNSKLREIKLDNNPNLRSIQSLNGHPSVKYIGAKNCSIENLPINIPQLTDLYMSNNNLKNLRSIQALGHATDARKFFYFDQNRIQSITPQIRYVKNLYSLNLNGNQLNNMPSSILHMNTLRYLYIQSNRFGNIELATIISKFKIQMKCYAMGNYNEIGTIFRNVFQEYSSPDCTKHANDHEVYKSFPFELDFHSSKRDASETYAVKNVHGNIIVLNINKQEYVPPAVFCLTELRELYVHKTKFRTFDLGLPIAIERLASTLKYLTISNTPIRYLPEQFGRLIHLKELKLLNTGLTTLPNSIGKLSSLTYLDLHDNKLISLPSTIINTLSLQTLILDNNPDLRSIQALNGHSSLKFLHADNCQIERIPLNLSQLINLYMSNNSLTHLSNIHTLGNKTNKKKLFFFDNNSIRYLSPHIRQVNNLNFLNLNYNKLYILPMDIYEISTLQTLYIQNNDFSDKDLQEMVARFHRTHPKLKLCYSSKKSC